MWKESYSTRGHCQLNERDRNDKKDQRSAFFIVLTNAFICEAAFQQRKENKTLPGTERLVVGIAVLW